MSHEIDQRVVEMRFDNAQFEEKSRKTMRTLDRLREKLRFDGAAKGMEEIQAASDRMDFSGMEEGVGRVQETFRMLDVVAFTALQNITNKVIDTGERMVKGLSVDQIMSGWDKYTEKTGNVQTIMNATGKSIDQVNGYLNKLMWYSDETSYSFDEMTSALSQMTASGGKIEKMIPMIMGIANATADAGKTGSAFQSTIRNLTQSYSAGHLQLQDWKSLNLMGTATKALKQELIDTAVELGVLQEGQVTIASFESSLASKWANTTVMEKTFGKYASMMEAAYELTQKEGITSSEALERLKGQYGELAERAALAAQQATSFGQAIDSTKDAVSSKWMSIFETIFGNKEEATKTWTELSNRLYDVFVPGVEALNDRLREGLDTGWEQLRRRFGDQADLYTTALEHVAVASGAVSEAAIEEAGSFAKALEQGKVDAALLGTSLEETLRQYEGMLATVSEDDPRYSHIQQDYEAFVKLNEAVEDGTLDLGYYADKMSEVSGREHLMQSLWNVWDAIAKVMGSVHEAFAEIFPPTSGEEIHSIAEGLDSMTRKLIISDEAAESLKKTFKGIFSVIKVPVTLMGKLAKTVSRAFGVLVDVLRPVGGIFLEVGAGMGTFLEEMQKTLLGTGSLSDKLDSAAKSTQKLLHPLTTLGDVLKKSIGEKLSEARKEISKWADSLPEGAKTAMNGVLNTLEGLLSGGLTLTGAVLAGFDSLRKKLMNGLLAVAAFVTGQTDTLMGYTDVIAQLPAIVGSAVSAFAEEFKGAAVNVENAADGVFGPVKAFFTALKEGFDSISGTDIYRFLSLLDVGLLSYAIAQFAKGLTSLKKMLETPLTGLLNAMSGTFKGLTSALKTWQKQENTKILTGMASALLMLAGAMFLMSKIDPEQFLWVAGVTAVLIAELATVAKLLKPEIKAFDSAVSGLGSQLLKASTLWGTAAALLGLAVAVKAVCGGFTAIMEALQKGDLAANVQGFATVVAGMAALVAVLGRLTATLKMGDKVVGGKTLMGMAGSLIAMGVALKVVASAVEPLSKIQYTSLAKAVGAIMFLGATLSAMGAALVMFQNISDTMLVFQNGAAITAMAGGLWILAQAVGTLAGIETEKLENAMTSMKTLMVLMTALSVLSSKTHIGSGAAVLAMAGAMQIAAAAALSLTLVPVDSLKKAAAVLGGLTAAMYVLGKAGANAGTGLGMMFMATAMLEMAAAILAVAGAAWVLDKAPWPGLAYAAAALGGLALAAGLLSKFAGSANVFGVGLGMMSMAAALLILAPAIRMLGEADPEHVASAMWAFATGMMAVFVGGMILTCIPELAVGLELLAGAFKKFGQGMLYLAGATALFGLLALFADPLCQAIINAAPDIEDALVAVITLLCDTLNRCTEPLGEALATVMKVLIQTAIDLIGWAWDGGDTGNGGIKGALDKLWDEIVAYFKERCKPENMFEVREGSFADMLIKGITGKGNSGLGKDDGFEELGENGAKGYAKGFQNGQKEVNAAAGEMAESAADSTAKAQDSHSPSKVFEKLGQYCMEGYALGLENNSLMARVQTAMRNVATAIRTVFTTYWGIHSPSDLAASDAENILEGAALGMKDPEARQQLYDETYNATLEVKNAADAALSEAETTISAKMDGIMGTMRGKLLEMYRLFPQTLNPDNLLANTQYNADKKKLLDAVPDYSKEFPGKNGLNIPKQNSFATYLQKVLSGEMEWTEAVSKLPTMDLKDAFKERISDVIGYDLNAEGTNGLGDALLGWYDQYLPDAEDLTGGSGGSGKSSGKGKTLAETISEKYTKELKANKYLQDAASKEYALWEAGEGDTADITALIEKKGEALAASIELQTARVDIAQRQYDELLSRVGAEDDKTKDARATLLDEKKNLIELQKEQFESTYKAAIERYESDDKLAQTEYQIWADTYEKTAGVTEKSNRNIEAINKRLALQSKKTALAEKAWVETQHTLGEKSLTTQQMYQSYLEARSDEIELENELMEAQLDAFDKLSDYYDSRISAAQQRQSLLNKLYNDGDLSGRADAYASAVEQYGEGSLEARRAATQGTMTALMSVAGAMNNMRFQLAKVTSAQDKYAEALRQSGNDPYTDEAMNAYEAMMSTRSAFADYMGDLADAFDVSDGTKRAMMQVGDAIAKNWKSIQNGVQAVMDRVNPKVGEGIANTIGLYTKEGASETIAAAMNAVVAAMNGDWATAVASGLSAVLDVVGTDFGRTLSEVVSNALLAAFGGNGLFAQLLTTLLGNVGQNSGSSKGIFSTLLDWGKSLLGMKSSLDTTMATLNAAGQAGNMGSGLAAGMAEAGIAAKATTKAIAGTGGLTKAIAALGTKAGGVLTGIGGAIAKIAASLGPHGLLIGAAVAGGTLLLSNWDKVKEGLGSVFDWILEKASGLWESMKEVGGNMMSGLASGIKATAKTAIKIGISPALGIVNGFMSILGIHSPSKVMAQMGVYTIEGLTNGILSTESAAEEGMEQVGSAVLDSARTMGEHIADFLTGDEQPHIQPIIDLSDAERGSAWLNSAFADRRGVISMAETTTGRMARNVRTAVRPQNGTTGPTFVTQSNRDVVEAVNAMSEHIDRIAASVQNMKVVMNSRRVVGEIKSDLNDAVGEIVEKGH